MSLFNRLFKRDGAPTNPALERAMHEVARSDNARTRESLYKAVLGSTLIVQGSVSGGTEVGNGERIANNDTRFAFRTVEHPPGKIVLPVFTDLEAMTSWVGSEVQWVAMRAQELFQSIASSKVDELRINPFQTGQSISRPGGILTRNEFMALAQGFMPLSNVSNVTQCTVTAGQKFLIGAPAQEPPVEVLRALVNYLGEIPELRGAYLFQMANQSVTGTVVGLQFDNQPNAERMQQIMLGIGQFVRGAIPVEASIDFMPLVPGSFLDSVQKCGKVLLKK